MFYSVCLHSTRQLLNYSERAEQLCKDDKDNGKLLAAFPSKCKTRCFLEKAATALWTKFFQGILVSWWGKHRCNSSTPAVLYMFVCVLAVETTIKYKFLNQNFVSHKALYLHQALDHLCGSPAKEQNMKLELTHWNQVYFINISCRDVWTGWKCRFKKQELQAII